MYCNLVDLRRCPRSPPPSPACPPLQRLDAWEQHLDLNSGRCYYINSLTGSKSWKPPRHTRTREMVRPPYCLSLCPLNPFLCPTEPQSSVFSLWGSQKNQKIVRPVLRVVERVTSKCNFTSPFPQIPGSMQGAQTLNRDNSILQPQAKGSESDTGTPELLGPQVRSLPP